VATGWVSDNQFDNDAYGTIVVAATLAVLIVLLARAFALRKKTNAAPALVAAGLTGAILWALELAQNSEHRRGDLGASAWVAVGFGLILTVGLVKWSDRAGSRA